MKRLLPIGAGLLCLTLSVSCSKAVPMPVVIRPELPEMLTAPTPEPPWMGSSNMELVEYIFELRQSLGMCNADKAAIAASIK